MEQQEFEWAELSPPRPIYQRVLIAAALAVVGVIGWYIFFHDDLQAMPPNSPEPIAYLPPPDPRLTFPTPFRNVKPDVRYVGDAKCASCHDEIDKTFHAHPMGRSAEFIGKSQPVERFDATAHNPFTVGPYKLAVEWSGGKMLHRLRVKDPDGNYLPDYVTTADLAIGSGTRGRSYLCIEKGAVWQTPISWFGPEARWDLSPGFDLGNGGRREIRSDCLFCHMNQVEPIAASLNRYREPFPVGQASIGCERCHGPGELHVDERGLGPPPDRIDTSIVNPKHLSSELRAGICAQCHLQGEERIARRGRELSEYRPGLPLEMYLTTFVWRPELADLHKSVGQFEQMQQSRCFTESRGALGCTSCHDPHAMPTAAKKENFYASRCLACHGQSAKECSEKIAIRHANADSCIKCHMPRLTSSNVAHTSITDHQIPRKPDVQSKHRGLLPGAIPIVAFPIGPHVPTVAEQERDLGIAMARAISHIPAEETEIRQVIASMSASRLTASVSTWRGDTPAWMALSRAQETLNDVRSRLDSATTAAALAPESDEAQGKLAAAAAAAGKLDIALAAANETVRMSPTSVEAFLIRAWVFLLQQDWVRAEADCRAALAIHPLHPRAHLLLGICRYRRGDPTGGGREADLAASLATTPQLRTNFRDLYRSQTR
ncbi:MAG TPA: tetratricopeptide repeat protein [Pirellulales bacterium]|nr:tetratricopeptide repeat protein [Pirellulales bacterium]